MQRKLDGMILHADLFVRSMNCALEFYTKVGFSVVDDTLLRGPLVHHLSNGSYDELRLVLIRASTVGAMIELLEFQKESALSSCSSALLPTALVSILVTDLEFRIDNAKSKGLDPASEIFTVKLPRQGSCKLVFYEDPDGNRLEFMQMM